MRVMPVPPHRCVAPAKLATLLVECVLAPGEAALTWEENLCLKGKLASFRWCLTKSAAAALVEQKELAVCEALG